MKKYLSIIIAFAILFATTVSAAASEAVNIAEETSILTSDELFYIVDGEDFISVTEEQFNEFDINTDIEEFIENYSLERELPVITEVSDLAQSMTISRTRASVNLTGHTIGSGGMYYYDASNNPFLVNAGRTFKISLRISAPQYPATFLGYYDYQLQIIVAPSASGTSPSASYKFTTAKAVCGYAKPNSPGSITVSSGSISW